MSWPYRRLPDRVISKEVNSPFYSILVDRGFCDFFNLSMEDGYWFGPNDIDEAVIINKGKGIEGADPAARCRDRGRHQ